MSLSDELAAQFARLDADAWAAIASRGLLRRARKDLEVTTPELVAEESERVEIAVGERRVSFGPDGVAGGRCSCPSPTACQHLLAAGLWLARSASGATEAPAATIRADGTLPENAAGDRAGAAPASEPPAATLMDEVVATPLSDLVGFAGRPGVRWALAALDDLDPDEGPVISAGRLVQVRLPGREVTLRYPGGGLSGWVVTAHVRDARRYVALAVLACQRRAGLDPRLDARQPARAPSARALAVRQSQSAVLAAAAALLRDCIRTGLAHASPSLAERLESTGTWAQGAELYRLARELRRVGEEFDLQVERSAAADDERLFVDLTQAAALTAALRGHLERGERIPAALAGQPRARYEPQQSLELVGLGTVPWRSVTGYSGLTAAFARLDGRGVATWTDARPDGVRGFDPIARWTAPGPWQGLASPAATAGSLITLTRAAVSADARISGTEKTSARVRELSYGEFRDLVPAYADFHAARREHAPLPRSPLDQLPAARSWVVLELGGWEPARFDVVRQRLSWPLRSPSGQSLTAELAYDPLRTTTLARIEALSRRAARAGTLLVGRLWLDTGGIVVEPVAVVQVAERPVDPLFVGRGQGEESRFVAAVRGGGPGAQPQPEPDPEADLPRMLRELRSWLQQAAERGLSGADDAAVVAELRRLHERARAQGYVCFPAHPGPDAATAIMRSRTLLRAVAVERLRG